MTEKEFKTRHKRVYLCRGRKTLVSMNGKGPLKRSRKFGMGLVMCECGCETASNQDKWLVDGRAVDLQHGMNMIHSKAHRLQA